MTLLEFVKELNDLVANSPVEAQKEVNLDSTMIILDDNTVISWDEDDDWYEDDCDYEVGFDPYLGCFTDDC